MKKILLFILIVFFSFTSFSQKNNIKNLSRIKAEKVNAPSLSKDVSGWITYSGDPSNNIGTGGAADFGCFMHIPTTDLDAHNARQIQEVMIQIAQPENVASIELRIYEEVGTETPGTPVYSQSFTPNPDGSAWTVINILPYTIDSNQEVIIGYFFNTTGGHPASCDGGPLNLDGNLMIWEGGWTHLNSLSSTLTGNWCIKAGVGDASGNDASMFSSTVNGVVQEGTVDITGTIANFGSSQINSFDINWQIDGGTIYTENINSLTIDMGQTYDFTHTNQWAASVGNYTLKTWVSNMNGNGNDDNTSNDEKQKEIKVIYSVDADLSELSTPSYNDFGDIKITGKITNSGSNIISSYDISYNIDGGTESPVYNISGLSIAYNETHKFIHDVQYNFNANGEYTINVTVSNVNGGGETFVDNNILSKSINIVDGFVHKKVILENFTTGQCPNCPPIHVLLEEYADNQPNAILIAQHAGYYTDEMTIPENTELLALYNDGGSTYAPALTIDRHYYTSGLVTPDPDPGPVFWPGESTSATITRINEKLAIPTDIKIDLYGTLLPNGDVDLYVTGELRGNITGDDLRVSAYIVEDGLIYYQSGGSDNYEHNNVMRDAISETWGDAGVIKNNTAGTRFFKHYIYTPDASWVTNNLSLVGFVSNYDSGDMNNREILNGEKVKLTELILPSPIASYIPSNDETGVSVLSEIVINFNQTMRLINDDQITADNVSDFIHLSDPSKGDLLYTAIVNSDQTQITITPNVPFSELTVITITIDNNEIENVSDESFIGEVFSFSTDNYPLADVVFSPSDNATNIYVNSNIILTFGSLMRKVDNSEITDGDISSMLTLTDPSKGEIPYTGTINIEKTVITIDPTEDFSVSTNITVSIAGDIIENQFDNVLAAATATFTTSETNQISALLNRINIYPNPTKNVVFISNAQNSTVRITDLYGKALFETVIISDTHKINTNNLLTGLYIINFEIDGFKTSKKLIIVK